MTTLPNKYYSDGDCEVAEETADQIASEERSGKGNLDGRFQVQQEKDGNASTQWMTLDRVGVGWINAGSTKDMEQVQYVSQHLTERNDESYR